MSEDVMAALTRCLQDLRLATVRSQYEAVARQATAESWSYADFLRELVQRECQQRQHNRIERLLKASRLPLEKSWSALDLKRLPPKVVQQLRGLLSGEFLDRRENVLVFGPPGSGRRTPCARWPRNWCGPAGRCC
jgi:DNA replication protein DnaC